MIAYILSLSGLLSMIAASLVKGKNMKAILVLVFTGNMLIATGYLFEGKGLNGAAACYLGAVLAVVNYFFESKNKPVPKWMLFVYVAVAIVLNIWVAGSMSLPVMLVLLAFMAFIMGVVQKNGAKYR